MDQQALIDHLKQISHLFGKNKDTWRSRAFSKAAGELETLRGELVLVDGKLVDKIPGVGSAITDVIEQFAATGTSKKMEKLRKLLPDEVVDRFDASTCKRKVTTLFRPLTKAGVDWDFAGSMRRKSATVRDVDVVIVLKNEKKEKALVEKILKGAGLSADVRNGSEKVGVSVPIKSQGRAFTLDINFTKPETRGSMYLYFTGPKAFGIGLRAKAKAKGMRLNQNGLFKNGKCLASKTEEDMFKALGMKYIEPEERA